MPKKYGTTTTTMPPRKAAQKAAKRGNAEMRKMRKATKAK